MGIKRWRIKQTNKKKEKIAGHFPENRTVTELPQPTKPLQPALKSSHEKLSKINLNQGD